MKELDKNYAYYLKDLNKEQEQILIAHLRNKHDWNLPKGIIDERYLEFYCNRWFQADELEDKAIIVNAITLFEPQFKQGDKVLVSTDGKYWTSTEFVCYYKDYYYTIHGRAKHIKPYEEGIKVGDWVKRNNEIIRIEKGNRLDNNWTKITNPELIELLNNEL